VNSDEKDRPVDLMAIGSSVMLRSGGPVMTIVALENDRATVMFWQSVESSWAITTGARLTTQNIPLAALVLAQDKT